MTRGLEHEKNLGKFAVHENNRGGLRIEWVITITLTIRTITAFLFWNVGDLFPFELETLYMKRLLTWVCLLGFLAGVLGEAVAQEEPKKKPDREAAFKKMDKDSDGKLTLEEFKANKKDKALQNAEKQFARIDKNSDKSISLEEFKAQPAPKPKKKDE